MASDSREKPGRLLRKPGFCSSGARDPPGLLTDPGTYRTGRRAFPGCRLIQFGEPCRADAGHAVILSSIIAA
jgi:hypothetical protein